MLQKISVCFQGSSIFVGSSTQHGCNMKIDLTCSADEPIPADALRRCGYRWIATEKARAL